MIFSLEVLPAHEGDCLILHWGESRDKVRVAVIDGGPGDTYEAVLSDRLAGLATNLKDGDTLPIEFAMVSHVDNDHIIGINALFREMRDAAPADRRFRVFRLWHNTFDDIVGNRINAFYKPLASTITASTGAGELDSAFVDELQQQLATKHPGLSLEDQQQLARTIGEIFAGQPEGRTLRDMYLDLREQGWVKFPLNAPFERDGKPTLLSLTTSTPMEETMGGMTLKIFGPLQGDIDALQAAFDEMITKKGLTVEAVFAAYADKSIPNLSSIVCVASAKVGGKTKTMLLTGDARGDKVIEGLRKGKVLPMADGTVKFDILKVPHHGSDRNTTAGFFQTISADHYVISADGKHGNPDLATVKWIIESRDPTDVYTLYFTYPLEEIDAKRKQVAASHGKAWNAATDSIEIYLKEKKAAGGAFEWNEGASLLVDLGNPVDW